MAGRKPQIELLIQLNVYEKYKDSLFLNGKLKPSSDIVFVAISNELKTETGTSISVKSIHLSISRNLHVFKDFISDDVHILEPNEDDAHDSDNSIDSNSGFICYELKSENGFTYLKPNEKIIGKANPRLKKVLSPGWADDLVRDIFGVAKLECNWIFEKRGFLFNEFQCEGHCKECESKIFISTEQNFTTMKLKIQPGLLNTVHLSKRKLGGQYVEILENDLKQFKPLKVHDKMSSKAITTDGIEPAYLISENAVKQFSYRNRAKLNVGKDPIDGLLNLKKDLQYGPSIIQIGLAKFYVFYWTQLQKEWYHQYNKTEEVILSCDASGRMVSPPIPFIENRHVFQYNIMAKTESGKSVP